MNNFTYITESENDTCKIFKVSNNLLTDFKAIGVSGDLQKLAMADSVIEFKVIKSMHTHNSTMIEFENYIESLKS